MRVCFLTLYPEEAASPRYRVGQYLPYLREHGVQCDVMAALPGGLYRYLKAHHGRLSVMAYHGAEFTRRVAQMARTSAYDVVFVQKAILSIYLRGATGLVNLSGRPLVYDIDDAVHLKPPNPMPRLMRWLEEPDQGKRLFQRADLVLAGNRWIAQEAEAQGGRSVVFPTVVDTARFTPVKERAQGYRVGWIGSPSTTPALREAGHALGDLTDMELVLVGADRVSAPWRSAQIVPWRQEEEVEVIQTFDVGLMPLAKDAWSRGKCALKALQYMACGVPCVATPYGAVEDIIEDGRNGLFADTPDAWREAIERLRDDAFRAELGAAASVTVEERYSLETSAPRLLALLEEVSKSHTQPISTERRA